MYMTMLVIPLNSKKKMSQVILIPILNFIVYSWITGGRELIADTL